MVAALCGAFTWILESVVHAGRGVLTGGRLRLAEVGMHAVHTEGISVGGRGEGAAQWWSLDYFWTRVGPLLDYFWSGFGLPFDWFWSTFGLLLDCFWTSFRLVSDYFRTVFGLPLDWFRTAFGPLVRLFPVRWKKVPGRIRLRSSTITRLFFSKAHQGAQSNHECQGVSGVCAPARSNGSFSGTLKTFAFCLLRSGT